MTGGTPANIRVEAVADAASVRCLLEAAFGGAEEADLVARLRAADDLVLALVAEQDRRVAGYVAFVRLAVEHDTGEMPAVGLAPLAVAPELQRRGIGSALVRAGLARIGAAGERLVFVLGETSYYRRFGFERASEAFRSPYSGPHFMALSLLDGAPSSGTIRYPAAFADLP